MCKIRQPWQKEGSLRFLDLLFFAERVIMGETTWVVCIPFHGKGNRLHCCFIPLCEVNCFIYSRWDSQLIFVIAKPLFVVFFFRFPSLWTAFIHSINVNVKQWSSSCVENVNERGKSHYLFVNRSIFRKRLISKVLFQMHTDFNRLAKHTNKLFEITKLTHRVRSNKKTISIEFKWDGSND